MNLGLDFGNVISKEKGLSVSNDPDFMDREFVEDAVESIAALVPLFNNVYIVSKCSEVSETLIPQWLKQNLFFEKTKIKPENIRFCRERHEKAPICKDLGITHFIDDRVEVLTHMKSVRIRIALNAQDVDSYDHGLDLKPDGSAYVLESEIKNPGYSYSIILLPTWQNIMDNWRRINREYVWPPREF